jgi:hypothetical protein
MLAIKVYWRFLLAFKILGLQDPLSCDQVPAGASYCPSFQHSRIGIQDMQRQVNGDPRGVIPRRFRGGAVLLIAS